MSYDELNPVPTGNEIKDKYPDINPTPDSTATNQPSHNPEAAPMTTKAAEVARDLVDRLAEKAAEAEVRIRGASHQASDEVRARAGDMQQQTRELTDTVEQYLQEHPIKALGIAFGAGLLVSTMLRRS